jgi:hypothetical protein
VKRGLLVSSGVLPVRNEHLERLAPWPEHLLHDKPARRRRPDRALLSCLLCRRTRPGLG